MVGFISSDSDHFLWLLRTLGTAMVIADVRLSVGATNVLVHALVGATNVLVHALLLKRSRCKREFAGHGRN